jgi:hypothetical protein
VICSISSICASICVVHKRLGAEACAFQSEASLRASLFLSLEVMMDINKKTSSRPKMETPPNNQKSGSGKRFRRRNLLFGQKCSILPGRSISF